MEEEGGCSGFDQRVFSVLYLRATYNSITECYSISSSSETITSLFNKFRKRDKGRTLLVRNTRQTQAWMDTTLVSRLASIPLIFFSFKLFSRVFVLFCFLSRKHRSSNQLQQHIQIMLLLVLVVVVVVVAK